MILEAGRCLDRRYKCGGHGHIDSTCLSLSTCLEADPDKNLSASSLSVRRVQELPVEKKSETGKGRESIKCALRKKSSLSATEICPTVEFWERMSNRLPRNVIGAGQARGC